MTLVPILKKDDFEVLVVSRQPTNTSFTCDFLNGDAVNKTLDELKPSVIINLVGLTDVEACEKNPNLAYQLNVRTVENIADWMQNTKSDCHLIHISTDHVYDGPGLHSENEVSITNYYAFQSMLASWLQSI